MKKAGPRIIGTMLVLLVTLYFVFQIYYIVSPNYRTEIAVLYEVTDEITAEGTVVRGEKVAHSDSGVKYFIVSDGDKVAAGSVVAERYENSEIAEKGIALSLLRQEAAVLSSIQSGNRGTANLSSLNRSIYNTLSTYTDERLSGDLTNVGKEKIELLSLFGAYALSSGADMEVQSRLDEVNHLIAELAKENLHPSEQIYTADSGYFISFIDGCEDIFADNDLEELSVKEIVDKINLAHSSYSYNDSDYKILSDFSWEYVCHMSADQASRLRTGRTYTLGFQYTSVGDIPAKVSLIKKDESMDEVVVVFSIERLNPAIALLRNEDVTIKFYNYSGIRVRRSSMRLVDGDLGVFIKYGDTVKFRKVNIIYETEDYIISGIEDVGDQYLTMYDEVIVTGKDLYVDKKLA
ncbi:MAG: hypothetical protein IJ091_04045 [Oscillospiraceae bacterium]|nr:hypothetical protein [Oscillospiraceae bacterium]